MYNGVMRKACIIFLSLVMMAVIGLPVRAQAYLLNKVNPAAQQAFSRLAADARVAVIVRLNEQINPQQVVPPPGPPAGRAQAVIRALQAQAARTQAPLLADLKLAQARGEAGRVTSLWIINAVVVEASPALLSALALRPDVAQITLDDNPSNPIVPAGSFASPALAAGPPEPNLSVIGATDLWAMGYRGQGVTVAILDSGVDGTQPDLAGRYRGGSNSWYDPYGQFAVPTDSAGAYTGHGTGVTGIVLGDGSGNATQSRSTGVAPAAQWIAAKIFNSAGGAVISSVHQAFQWVLDPDGDPATPDAPQIVNNSWDFTNPGACDLEFQPDVTALRAAGISVVFAAGNTGPGANTSVSPANNLGVISAGAVDNTGAIASFSALGPNACDATRLFPSLVAPGVSLMTTGLGGTYVPENGTSFSAPHVSGGLALLLSLFHQFSPDQLEAALSAGSTDLGALGPDSTFGNGLLNLPASRALLYAPLYSTYLPLIRTSFQIYLPMVQSN
jgi:subtilisin family serine protease